MNLPLTARSKSSRPSSTGEGLSFGRSLLAAVVLELLLLAVGAYALIHAASKPPVHPEPVMLAIEEPVLEKPKVQPKPPEPKPEPKPRVEHAPTPPQAHPLPQVQPPEPTPQTPPPPSEMPFAQTVTPPAPPPPPADNNDKAEADFAGRIKAAIQAVTVYPMVAQQMGVKGRTRVEFLFLDGAVSQVRVAESSGNGLLDRSALAAVATASYPPVPEALRGKQKHFFVWVWFPWLKNL